MNNLSNICREGQGASTDTRPSDIYKSSSRVRIAAWPIVLAFGAFVVDATIVVADSQLTCLPFAFVILKLARTDSVW